MIDEIIELIRTSDDPASARTALTSVPFDFSEIQANHILDMALSRLTRLGKTGLEEEAAEKRALIEELEALLSDEFRIRMQIRDELLQISESFAVARRSSLEIDPGELDIEDLIDDDDLVFTMSASGYVKTVPTEEFRLQGRGGRGVAGTKLKQADSITHLIHTTAHSYLLFFSNRGRVYRLKAHQVPVASRTARGTSIANLLSLQDGERIQAVIDTRDYEMNRYLFFATANGRVKRTKFTAYDSSRQAGLIAIRLRDGDELVAVVPTNGEHDILLSSRLGQTIRFAQDQVREMGRTAAGVIGLKFKHSGDTVVSCTVARPEAALLYVTTLGYGKRTPVDAFRRKRRAGRGMVGAKLVEAKGELVGTLVVDPDDEILAVTSNGVVIRLPVSDVSEQGSGSVGRQGDEPRPRRPGGGYRPGRRRDQRRRRPWRRRRERRRPRPVRRLRASRQRPADRAMTPRERPEPRDRGAGCSDGDGDARDHCGRGARSRRSGPSLGTERPRRHGRGRGCARRSGGRSRRGRRHRGRQRRDIGVLRRGAA